VVHRVHAPQERHAVKEPVHRVEHEVGDEHDLEELRDERLPGDRALELRVSCPAEERGRGRDGDELGCSTRGKSRSIGTNITDMSRRSSRNQSSPRYVVLTTGPSTGTSQPPSSTEVAPSATPARPRRLLRRSTTLTSPSTNPSTITASMSPRTSAIG
jgi:hypothetical protein